MADSTAFPSQRQASNDTGYRRISTFAIGGLAVGVLFVLFLLLQIGAGLLAHATVLMPPWMEVFAVLGVVLSLIGVRAIRHSNGTLAGLKIARTGVWLSLVAGLGYLSYYGATYMAVRQQADVAVHQWFEKICQGKVNEAFLLTQPAAQRRRANPDDPVEMERLNTPLPGTKTQSKGGMLDVFRYNELIHLLQQGGSAVKITPLGVREWEEKQGVYVVRRVYQVECPEAKFSMQVTAMGSEDPTAADKGRSWWVAFMESSAEKESLRKTKLGERVDALRASAQSFMRDWANLVKAGELQKAYLKSLDPKQQKSLEGTAQKTPPPGFEAAFTKGGLLDFNSFHVKSPEVKTPVEQALRSFLAPVSGSKEAVINFAPTLVSTKRLWSVDADKRILFPVECKFAVGTAGSMPQYMGEVIAWLQSEPGQLDSTDAPSWRLTKIEVLQAGSLDDIDPTLKFKQGGPP